MSDNQQVKNKEVIDQPVLGNFKFDAEYLEKLSNLILENTIRWQDLSSASLILKKLKPFFIENRKKIENLKPGLYKKWQKVFAQLQWIMFHALDREEILSLIRNYFIELFSIPFFDLFLKFKAKMVWIPFDDRDSFRAKIREALAQNEQILTKESVIIDTIEKKGSIKNWIKDYNNKLGTDLIDNIKFSQYITKSQNTAELSEESRERLKLTLSFYEYLKRSSLSFEGSEESIAFIDRRDGKLKIFNDGELTEAASPRIFEKLGLWQKSKKNKKNLEKDSLVNKKQAEFLKSYYALPIPLDQIRAKVVQLDGKIVHNPHLINQILYHPKAVKDPAYVIAALFVGSLQNKLGIKNKDRLQKFVRKILEQDLRWNQEDSAKIGIRLANILGDQYKGWAYYNKEIGEFRWNQ